MIVILKNGVSEQKVDELVRQIESRGLSCHRSTGAHTSLVGIIGDTSTMDIDALRANDMVEDVKRVSEPYKAANRKFHPDDTIVSVPDTQGKEAKLGGGFFSVIAGPCSVETEEQIVSVARDVKKSGASCCAAALLSPAPRPIPFRGFTPKDWSC